MKAKLHVRRDGLKERTGINSENAEARCIISLAEKNKLFVGSNQLFHYLHTVIHSLGGN
jgi:hypothetical protein